MTKQLRIEDARPPERRVIRLEPAQLIFDCGCRPAIYTEDGANIVCAECGQVVA